MQRCKEIHEREWAAAQKHCRFPGIGRPVPPKPKYFQRKLHEDIVSDFLQWMHANDFIQNVAFRHKVVSYCNGVHTAIEAVKLTANQHHIVREYAKEWQQNEESAAITENDDHIESRENTQGNNMNVFGSDDRCCGICPKTRTRCFKENGHEERHSFTPKGQLSASSIEKFFLQ